MQKASFLITRLICENNGVDQLSVFVFATQDSTVLLLTKTEISSPNNNMAVQPGLCRTWLETTKTGFLAKLIICESSSLYLAVVA